MCRSPRSYLNQPKGKYRSDCPLWGFLSWSAGASTRPPAEGERRSILASSRRLCLLPEQAESPAGGLRPADTRQYLGGESECNVPVRSTSLPPFLWVNKKLQLLFPHLTHPRHTCTLGINLYTQNHTHAKGAYKSFSPGFRLLWQFVLVSSLHPPVFFVLFLAASEVLLSPADFQMSIYSPWFNCVVGKICLKSLSFHILHYNRSHWLDCTSRCLVPGPLFRDGCFIFLCMSALYLKIHKLTFDESPYLHQHKLVHMTGQSLLQAWCHGCRGGFLEPQLVYNQLGVFFGFGST